MLALFYLPWEVAEIKNYYFEWQASIMKNKRLLSYNYIEIGGRCKMLGISLMKIADASILKHHGYRTSINGVGSVNK